MYIVQVMSIAGGGMKVQVMCTELEECIAKHM